MKISLIWTYENLCMTIYAILKWWLVDENHQSGNFKPIKLRFVHETWGINPYQYQPSNKGDMVCPQVVLLYVPENHGSLTGAMMNHGIRERTPPAETAARSADAVGFQPGIWAVHVA